MLERSASRRSRSAKRSRERTKLAAQISLKGDASLLKLRKSILPDALQDALAVKISLDLLNGLCSYGGFKLTGSYSQNLQRPLAAKLCIRPQKF